MAQASALAQRPVGKFNWGIRRRAVLTAVQRAPVIHEIRFGERKRIDHRLGIGNARCVDDQNDALSVAARIPLADLAFEVKTHRRAHLLWNYFLYLFALNARFRDHAEHDVGGLRAERRLGVERQAGARQQANVSEQLLHR